MTLRPTTTLLLALGLTLAPAAIAAPGRIIAFGDSVTEGKGFDDPQRPEPGYPLRLEELLQDEELQVDVQNTGKGGEDTTQGITRLDGLMAAGDLVLVLMEGTNDISRDISPETTLFNLDQMARKAEALGIIPLHATLIPRYPLAKVDSKNILNAELADGIRALAAERGRPLADPYERFSAIPKVFDKYYSAVPKDPVGHPNAQGFELLSEIFAPIVVEALADLTVTITLPTPPVAVGQPARFEAVASEGVVASTEWRFSDGGRAWSAAASPRSATYVFTEPGSYDVRLIARDRFGRTSEATAVVAVVEGALSTVDLESYVQWVANGSFADGLESGCEWRNRGGEPVIVDVAFLMRGNDTIPETRHLQLPAGAAVSFTDVLADLFEQPDTLGSLRLMYRSLSANAPRVWTTCRLFARSPSPNAGFFGDGVVPEDPATEWDEEVRIVAGLHDDGKRFSTVRVANLDDAVGNVSIEIFDAAGEPVGFRPAVFDLTQLAMRQRRLVDIESDVRTATGPFTLRFTSDGIRFLASGTVTQAASKDASYVPAAGEAVAGDLYLLRVARGANTFADAQTTSLDLHNPTDVPHTVTLELVVQGAGKKQKARPSRTLTVAPGATLSYSDFVLQVFGQRSAAGALRIVPVDEESTPLVVRAFTTRVENKVSYLTPIAPVAASAAQTLGQSAVALGLANSGSDRSNLGVLNLSTKNSTMYLRVRDRSGAEVGKGSLTVKAGAYLERALTLLVPKLPKATELSLEITVLQGGPVLPYALRTPASGDAFLLPFRTTTPPAP